MNPRLVLHIIFFFAFGFTLQAQLSLSTSSPDNNFEAGEEMNFIITSAVDTEITYTITFDTIQRSPIIESGKIKVQAGNPSYIPYTLNEPGTVLLNVSDPASGFQRLGAAFSPFSIGIYEECPADFDTFWANQKAQLASIPIDPVLTLFESTATYNTYRINIASVDNRRVYGYVTVPNGAGPFSAVLTLPPFGSMPNIANPEPTLTTAFDAISMSISIHNTEPDVMDPNSYIPDNIEVREEYYYRTSILAAVRSLDYIFSRSDFDGQNVVVTGNSQGGGLSICLAGIDNRVKAISVANPALCEYASFKYGRASGFPYYVWSGSAQNVNTINFDVDEASKYYDAKYFAQRIEVPCLVTTGYQDIVCPTSTVFGATNQLTKAPKLVVHALDIGHQAPVQYWDGRRNFYVRHLSAFENSSIGMFLSKGFFAEASPDTNGQVDQTISITGSTFDDDTLITTWPVKWELVAGPGKALFGNASQRSTTVQFDQAGTYTLRFSSDVEDILSTDGIIFTMQDFITITVN